MYVEAKLNVSYGSAFCDIVGIIPNAEAAASALGGGSWWKIIPNAEAAASALGGGSWWKMIPNAEADFSWMVFRDRPFFGMGSRVL